MERVRLHAPAKVNLHLGIHAGRDGRGYHAADSLMVAVGLFDEVEVAPSGALALECDPDPGCAPDQNTCWRAAGLLGEVVGREPRVAVRVRKHIPWRSGLGGASSDAAAVICGIGRLWGLSAEDGRLREAARAVGADVAFFLDARPALLGGVGDVVRERFPHAPRLELVLVRPEGEGVSTPAAYAAFDRDPQALPGPEGLCRALRAGDAREVARHLANNLAPAALSLDPAAADALAWLRAQPEAVAAQLTGSGSASFALCADAGSACALARRAQEEAGLWAVAAPSL